MWNNVKAHTIPSAAIPRLSYEAILALPSPHKGDLAYDLTHRIMQVYTTAGWRNMAALTEPNCDSFTAVSSGGFDNEITYDAATDNAGNVFVIGEFYGTVAFGEFTLSSAGDVDVFLAKYNASGELEWAKRAGGPHNDFGVGLTVDNAGNIYITGFFYTMMNFNDPSDWESNVIFSAGETDAFVAKYNASGEVQWSKRIGGVDNDNAQTIRVDNNGNVFVIGNFWQTANFNTPSASGSNELVSAGAQDIFMVKYTNAGDLQWIKRAGGNGYDYGNGIAIDATGNVYATGGFNETADFNMPSNSSTNALVSDGDYDIFIAKFANDGTIQWLKRAGGTSTDNGLSIIVDNVGNPYVTGFLKETANFNSPSASGSNELISAGGADAFIAKYDPSGNVLWLRRAGGEADDYGNDIGYDVSGNVYIAGNFREIMNFNTPSASGSNELISTGEQDIYVAKYSSSGEVIWLKEAGGAGLDQLTAMAIGSTGTVHTTGYFGGTSQFGSSSLTSSGGLDFFLTYITSPPPTPTGTSNAAICNNTTASLSATCAIGIIKWYDTNGTSLLFTGSPFVTPTLTANKSYKVSCEVSSCSSAFVDVTVTVNPVVAAPTGTANTTICNNTTTSLSASCSSSSVKWYDSNGTSLQGTGSPFVTPNLTSTTPYKVRCESGGVPDCSSAFVDVTVTVNPVVAAPTGTANTTICNNTTTSLSASCSSSSVKWYDSNGTALQGTGSSFVTPNLTSTTPYKVRCESGGVPNCSSAFVDVIVTVAPIVSNPTTVSVNSTAICSGTSISLSATCTTGTVTWYNQQTGGTIIGTTSPFVQSPVATTTYYVSCLNGACESARVATNQVVVTTQPTDPIAVSVSSTGICVGVSISLSATCTSGTVTWYDQQSGGTALGTGTNFSQSPTTNTTYYVSCKNGNCQSNRVATNLVAVTTSSTNLSLTTDISSGNSVQIATQTITATNKIISPANVIYKAGKYILLNAGFEAKSGSIFKAQIGGCSD